MREGAWIAWVWDTGRWRKAELVVLALSLIGNLQCRRNIASKAATQSRIEKRKQASKNTKNKINPPTNAASGREPIDHEKRKIPLFVHAYTSLHVNYLRRKNAMGVGRRAIRPGLGHGYGLLQ